MKKTISILLAIPFSLFAIDCSSASAIKEYNGHYYTITTSTMQFVAAKAAAENKSGYLAIPNTAAENEFIRSVIGRGNIAWIGVYDPSFVTNYCYEGEPCTYSDSRFRTIKNTTLSYRNWGPNQPDNLVRENDVLNGKQLVSPLGEHWVAMSGNNGQWFDEGNHAMSNNNPIAYKAVFEFDTKPQCFFENDENSVIDLKNRKCNTQVYENSSNTLILGETKDCLKDVYNNEYCPSAMAPARTYWSYDSGYSVAHTSSVLDYARGTYKERIGSVRDFADGTSRPHTNTELHKVQGTARTHTGSVRDWTASSTIFSPALEKWECRLYMDASGDDRSNGKGFTYWVSPGESSFTGAEHAKLPNCSFGEAGCGLSYWVTYNARNGNFVTFGAGCVATSQAMISGSLAPGRTMNHGRFYTHNVSKKTLYCANGSSPVNGNCQVSSCPTGYTISGSSCFRDVSYDFYSYGCPSGYVANNTGLSSCSKTDPNLNVRNDVTLASACNSSTPPADNCSASLQTTAYEYICGAGYTSFNSGITSCPSGTSGTCNNQHPPQSNCYKDISYKFYEYTCDTGYTIGNHGLTSCIKTDPNFRTNNEFELSQNCNTAVPPDGNCQKPIEYTYYQYLCYNQINAQLQNYTASNAGLTSCPKTDTDNITINSSTLSGACNSSVPPVDNCSRLEFTCDSTVRQPAWVNNQWQCSPFPCVGESNVQDLSASVGTSDKNNNGWDNRGNCNGQLYLFSGVSNKCRSWDAFAGLTGGGCCDRDKVFLGLVQCKATEKQLASSHKSGLCREIGEFCSKEMNLILKKVCIENSKSYCCFNSKFARILQEQGRPQLGIGWGIARNPICRGFTPQEFQKLDMSQMNLDEFINSIVLPDMTQITNTVQNRVQNHLNALSTP